MKHRIAEILEERGLSVRALARKTGRDPAQVSRVIRGKAQLTIELLLLFSSALGVAPGELVDADFGGRVVSAGCDQALMGAVISYVYEACEYYGIAPSSARLSEWITSVYDYAVKKELNLTQTREYAFCIIKIDPKSEETPVTPDTEEEPPETRKKRA